VVETSGLIVLGSTGSIGTQTLDVVTRLAERGERWDVIGLAAGWNVDRVAEQARAVRPRLVVVAEPEGADRLRQLVPGQKVAVGGEGIEELLRLDGAGTVVNALVGATGLVPTLDALDLDLTVALANKESLVIGGELVRDRLAAGRGCLVPIDSELSALAQCLRSGRRSEVRRVALTASGGTLLEVPLEALGEVTAQTVLAHPTWQMGRRITVDSTTMVNKGFEVVEAHFLFDMPYDNIDVLVHPSPVVHALVEFVDGTLIAHAGPADMRSPIQYALSGSRRVDIGLPGLPLTQLSGARFLPLDADRFPAFGVVLRAARHGATARAVVNAADEVLVERFLCGDLPFTMIASELDRILTDWIAHAPVGGAAEPKLDALLHADGWARAAARPGDQTEGAGRR